MKAYSDAQHPLFAPHLENYLSLLAREYSKPVSHHYAYVVSALLSENVFDMGGPNPHLDYDCIAYPSVGNNFHTRNLAIKAEVADRESQLVGAVEFEVSEQQYDRTPILTGNPASISVANVRNMRTTRRITSDGPSEW